MMVGALAVILNDEFRVLSQVLKVSENHHIRPKLPIADWPWLKKKIICCLLNPFFKLYHMKVDLLINQPPSEQ